MLPLPHFHSLLTLLQCSYGAPNAIQGTLFCTSAYLNIVQILQKSYKMVPLVHFYAHAHLQTFMCSWQNPFQMSSWRLQKWYPWYTFYTFQEFGLPRRNFNKIFEHPRFLQKSYKTVPLVHFSEHSHMSTSLFHRSWSYKILIFLITKVLQSIAKNTLSWHRIAPSAANNTLWWARGARSIAKNTLSWLPACPPGLCLWIFIEC